MKHTVALPACLASGVPSAATPLVLLHGMGSTASIWLPQLEYFGASRQTLAWTMPGYGASPALPQLSWDGLADGLAALLSAHNIKKAHLLGHSIGGMVAQAFAHRYPQQVESLVLSATSAAFGSRDPDWAKQFLRQRTEAMEPYAQFVDALPHLVDGLMLPGTPVAMRTLAVLSGSAISKQSYLASMQLLTTFNQSEAFKTLALPMLLLAGEHDTQAPPKGMQRLAQANPQARLQTLGGVAHMANIEAASRFNQAVDAFLAAQP